MQQFCLFWRFLYVHMSSLGRRISDLISFGAADVLVLKTHLTSGYRVIVPDGLDMDVVHQGNGERKKATSTGTSLSAIVVKGRNMPGYEELFTAEGFPPSRKCTSR